MILLSDLVRLKRSFLKQVKSLHKGYKVYNGILKVISIRDKTVTVDRTILEPKNSKHPKLNYVSLSVKNLVIYRKSSKPSSHSKITELLSKLHKIKNF